MAYKQSEILHIKIKELFNIEKGTLQSTKCTEGQYNFITASSEWKTHNEFTHDTEAIIIAVAASGSLGRAHYVNGKFISSDLCFILTPKSENYPLDLSFYYFIFNSIRDDLVKSTATGTSKLAINKSNFGAYQIPYLDVSKQKEFKNKLVNITQRKGQLVAINEKQTEIIQSLRQQILQDAITGKLSEKWRKENPNIESAEILLGKIKAEKERLVEEGKIRRQKPSSPIEESEIPFDLPEGWIWCRLGEILTKLTDGAHQTPGYVDEGIPFLSVKDISSGKIDFSNTKYITEEEHSELYSRCNPEFGDVLLTKVGTTGIAKVVDTHREFSLFVSVALLKFNQNLVYNYFLEYLINSPFVKRQSERETKGMGNQNLVLSKISNFLIPLPSIVEQHHIVARIESLLTKLDRIKETHIENQTNIDQINHILLKEMFKG